MLFKTNLTLSACFFDHQHPSLLKQKSRCPVSDIYFKIQVKTKCLITIIKLPAQFSSLMHILPCILLLFKKRDNSFKICLYASFCCPIHTIHRIQAAQISNIWQTLGYHPD